MMQQTGKGQREAPPLTGRAATARRSPASPLIDIADTLYRTAATACSEHRRYADLVERAAPDTDQRTARYSVRACDDALEEVVDLYELACLEKIDHADDSWWHRANMVWRSAKEYLRHHATSDRLTRGGPSSQGHGMAALVELSIEYKLEASALLRLRHTIDAYREVRPEAG